MQEMTGRWISGTLGQLIACSCPFLSSALVVGWRERRRVIKCPLGVGVPYSSFSHHLCEVDPMTSLSFNFNVSTLRFEEKGGGKQASV